MTASASVAGGAIGQSWFANSSGPTVALYLMNGTYSFVITSPGYQASSGASFTVSGHPVTLPPVTVSPTPSPSGLAGWVYVAIVVVVIVGVIAAVTLVMLRRRRPKSPA